MFDNNYLTKVLASVCEDNSPRDREKAMDDDSCIYANIAGEMEYHPAQQQQQLPPQQQREEMVIHPYNLVRARSSHSVLSGT